MIPGSVLKLQDSYTNIFMDLKILPSKWWDGTLEQPATTSPNSQIHNLIYYFMIYAPEKHH